MAEPPNSSLGSNEAEKPAIEPIRMPTVEEIRGQDLWNNCAMRSVVSGAMGMAKTPPFRFIFLFSYMVLIYFCYKSVCLVSEKEWEKLLC